MYYKECESKSVFHFLVFFILFSSAFGPKVLGVIDLTVLVPSFFILMIAAQSYKFIIFDKYLFLLVGFSVFIYFQLLLFNFSEHVEDPQFVLRNFRAFLSGIFVFLLIYSITKRGFVSHELVYNLIILSFGVCAFVVYLQAFFPITQPVFADLWGFDKPIRYLRAFGLSAGYDTTGYLLCWSAALILLRWLRFRHESSFFSFIFIAGAVLFTSRTSMAMLIGICALSIIVSASYFRIFSFFSAVVGSVALAFVYFFIFPIIAVSIFGVDVNESGFVRNVSDRFATTDVIATASDHFIIPDTEFGIIFGLGIDPVVDPGYSITIFRGGILLLFTFILFYLTSFLYVRKFSRSMSRYFCNYQAKWVDLWTTALFLLFVVIIVGNLKNLYFYTRGFHELFVFLVAISLGFCNREKLKLKQGGLVR